MTYSTISVPDNAIISSVDVGLRVDHPRISDLVFHLISPDGTRVLLMENRGGTSTNGIGGTYNISNIVTSASGGPETSTNGPIDTGQTSGTLAINYDFHTTNELAVYDQSWNLVRDFGMIIGSGVFTVNYFNSSKLFIVMNPFVRGGGSGYTWDFTINITQGRYAYLVLTENTNLTITPIKFAPPPFISVTNAAPPIPPILDGHVLGGPLLNPENPSHAYYLLDSETWTNSETWAEALGGHLVTIRNPSESSWVYGTFSDYGGVSRNLWIGLYDSVQDTNCFGVPAGGSCWPPCWGGGQGFTNITAGNCPSNSTSGCDYGDPCHSNNFVWVSGESVNYRNWSANQPDNCYPEYYAMIPGWGINPPSQLGCWNDANPAWNDYQPTYGVVEVTNFNLSTISPDIYYLPEQSLDAFAGKNAGGTWTLEIQDARTGAYLSAQLVSWQLRFTFVNSTPLPTVLNTNSAFTNQFITPGGIAYYLVEVPTSAQYATNILLFASPPLNVWFTTNSPPTITNAADDVDLIPNSMGNIGNLAPATLFTNTTFWPYIVPNGIYYLGVQNTNGVTVNYGLEVDFDNALVPFAGAFSASRAAVAGSGVQLQWIAPPDAQFQVEWATNISPPIVWTTNAGTITSTDGIFTFTDHGSTNSHARFYRLLQVQ